MPDTLVGLDLGKSGDPTALAVLRRHMLTRNGGLPVRGARGEYLYGYTCGELKRYQLGTSYPAIVEDVAALLQRPDFPLSPRLVIDATGVGSAVVDMFLQARLAADIIPLTITGGATWRREVWTGGRCHAYWVAKNELVSAMQAVFQGKRIWVNPKVEFADVLRKELADFRVTVTKSANETYAAREGAHDDMVLSVAMPVWVGNCRYTKFRDDSPQGESPEADAIRLAAEKEAESQEREKAAKLNIAQEEWNNPMANHWYGVS